MIPKMNALRFWLFWTVAVCIAGPMPLIAGDTSDPQKPGGEDASSVRYEVALIDKSMTGGWQSERAFRQYVKELFGVSKIHRFKLRGEPL